jgi:hypothetical protein
MAPHVGFHELNCQYEGIARDSLSNGRLPERISTKVRLESAGKWSTLTRSSVKLRRRWAAQARQVILPWMSSGAGVGRLEVARFLRRGAAGALVLLFLVAWPAAAQDQSLDPVLLANRDEIASAPDVEVRGFQLYRLPFSFHVRSVDKHPWGLRITFPVSLSSLRIEGVSDLGGFVDKLRIAAIIPGLEVEIPVGSRTLVRPFGEVGFGKSGDVSEVFYGAGLRVQDVADLKRLHLTYGGLIAGRKAPPLIGSDTRYASFEGGADVEAPLGFSVHGGQARGGIYVIGRAFDGLELERVDQPPIVLRGQFEAGLSFSTEPELRIWRIPLQWLAVGYQFGRVSGLRLYLKFPF